MTSETKVKTLRQQVAVKLKENKEDTILVYKQQELQDARTLEYYKIGDGSKITAQVE